jgi:hypothetical protein
MTEIVTQDPTDLTDCPHELLAVDISAKILWAEFLKRTGISMSVDRKTVIDNGSKRAWAIRNLGVPSLIQRLSAAKDEVSRARIWWRESIACSEGESEIPDITSDRMHVLNPFIVTAALKFPDPRAANLEKARAARLENAAFEARRRGRPKKSAEERRAAKAANQRRLRGAQRMAFA